MFIILGDFCNYKYLFYENIVEFLSSYLAGANGSVIWSGRSDSKSDLNILAS